MVPAKRVRPQRHPGALLSPELVTLAVYLLGGDSKEVDTEDVAMKANELAPGRFTWRKYRDQINIHNIGAFLSDAKKRKNGAYLSGTESTGWLLTDAGLQFAKANVGRLEKGGAPTERLAPEERRRRRNEQARISASEAFHKYSNGQAPTISMQEVEAVFRLNEYIVGQARQKKVQKIVNALGDDHEVGAAIRFFGSLALGESAR